MHFLLEVGAHKTCALLVLKAIFFQDAEVAAVECDEDENEDAHEYKEYHSEIIGVPHGFERGIPEYYVQVDWHTQYDLEESFHDEANQAVPEVLA